jgi:PAS domain S-box-containing protein
VIESLFGNGWAFDAGGRWIYLHPFAQNSLGVTLDDLNTSLEDGHSAWKKLLHPDDYDRVDDAWRHCLQTGDHFNVEFRFRRVTGDYVWARAAARPTRDEQGRITGWFGIALDVDVYKRTVVALRDRERELSHLVDMVPSLIWRLAPDGEPIFFNKRMVDFLGFDVSDTDKQGVTRLGAFIDSAVHPDDAAPLRITLSNCLITGDSFDLRYRLRRADGVYRWMSSRAEPMRAEAGRIVQWYGLCHDIDDQMHAEEALRKSERQLQQLVDAVPASIWCTERDGTPIYRNKRHANTTGASLKDFAVTGSYASPLAAMAHPDDRAAAEQIRANAFKSGSSYVVRYRQIRSDGTYRWTESRAEPLRDDSGEVLRWYGVSVDVHDLVTAQEALQRSEQELSQLVNLLPVHIRRLSPEGETIFFNKRLVDFVGLDLVELDKLGMSGLAGTVQTLIHPDDAASLRETISHSLATGESYANRYRVRRADGVYRWMEGRGEPVRDQHGAILQWYGISIDIDDEVRAQEALRQSERSLRQLVETLPAMLDCAAPNGEPVFRNRQLREYLGYDLKELDGTGKSRLDGTLDASVHPDDVAGVKEQYKHSLSTGEPFARRHRLRRFNGEYGWVETRAAPMRNADGAIVQWNVICLDIDGEVRAQEELRLARETLSRASQAASLAELSASIAHEVNQPLAAVVANSHACQRWLMAEPPNLERAQKTVERIIRDANSAADVVSRIRALFKQSTEARSSAALSAVIAEALGLMAEEAARRHVRTDVDVESNLPLMVLDRVQVLQVLINLIRNGMEAMDASAGDRVLGIRARRTGSAVQIEIRDRGHGVEAPDKIFEPFFTTKEHGMGMGLAICRSIIEAHGGRLWAEMNEPQGATFIFALPIELKAAA